MKNKISNLIDVKSIITLLLVLVLLVVVVRNKAIDDKLFNLYSNVLTMVMTYFFTKKTGGDKNDT